MMKEDLRIWTIGHSNRSIDTFLELLGEHGIQVLVDVRSFPTSKIEHFKIEGMKRRLPERGIKYVWLGKHLGGYGRGGYKRHMRTKLFREGVKQLLEILKAERACIMCMEVEPKYCHRRFISAHLERRQSGSHNCKRTEEPRLNFELSQLMCSLSVNSQICIRKFQVLASKDD